MDLHLNLHRKCNEKKVLKVLRDGSSDSIFYSQDNKLIISHKQMTSLGRKQSAAITQVPQASHVFYQKGSLGLQLRQFQLRKSIFMPNPALPEAYAARRHIPAANIPKVTIVHSSPKWLLLQAPKNKPKFFTKVNQGKLGCKQDLILKIFRSFISLIKQFNFFKPTSKMIFLEKMEAKVWIHQDIFRNQPMYPLSGPSAQTQFVTTFLSILDTYLEGWQKAENITNIQDAVKLLEWRRRLARRDRTAVGASQHVHFKQSNIQFEENAKKITTCSQHIRESKSLERVKKTLATSQTIPEIQLQRSPSQQKHQLISALSINKSQLTEATRLQFAPSSTSSSLQAFYDKWRTTVGRKKLMQKHQAQYASSPTLSAPLEDIQQQFQDLFQIQSQYSQNQLQKIAEQMQQILIW